jgi:16S rRNA (cytidine1402-2'-O)-methyltransferase
VSERSKRGPTGGAERSARRSVGTLQVVATPIGNLEDLSPRARRALAECEGIVCEDTRRTGRLLEQLGLPKKPMFSHYAPKEKQQIGPIVKRLQEGRTFVLVTDGGTPGVSDPGALLVGAAHRAGIPVEPVAGPSAVAVALSVSSLGGRAFVFEGFLPPKAAARRKRLEELRRENRTIVLYEAPHRLAAVLADLADLLGAERVGTIVREATKRHEEIMEAGLGELAERFAGGTKGEVVVVVEGAPVERHPDEVTLPVEKLLEIAQGGGLSPDGAARLVAQVTGLPRNRLVRLARAAADPAGASGVPPDRE